MASTTAVKTTTGAPKAPLPSGRHIAPWIGRRSVLLVSLALFALIWELIGRFWLDPIFFASFSATVSGLVGLLQSGVLTRALRESLELFIAGQLIGVSAGLLAGILIGRVRVLAVAIEDYVTLMYVTPPIVLVPFILSIIGFGFWPKVLIVVWFTFFPVCITTIEGVRATNPRLLEVARSFGDSELGIWRNVVIPSAVPFAMSGIRQGIALGLVGVVAAEFLLDSSGVGELLKTSSRLYRMDHLFASVLVMVGIGLVTMALGRKVEKRFAVWRP